MKRISIPDRVDQLRPPHAAGTDADACEMDYPADVSEAATKDENRRVGLCCDCQHVQRIHSARGSTFYRCGLSDTDPSFPKYPRLPVVRCAGYARELEKCQ